MIKNKYRLNIFWYSYHIIKMKNNFNKIYKWINHRPFLTWPLLQSFSPLQVFSFVSNHIFSSTEDIPQTVSTFPDRLLFFIYHQIYHICAPPTHLDDERISTPGYPQLLFFLYMRDRTSKTEPNWTDYEVINRFYRKCTSCTST